MSNLNIAILGFGNMGKIHYKAVLKNNLCNDPIVIDNDMSKFDDYPEVVSFESVEKVPKNVLESIDGAIIATPSSLHLEHSQKFIENKISLLVEKPLTDSIENDLALISEAKKNDLLLKCGLIELFNPIVQDLSKTSFTDIKFVHFKRHSPKTSENRKLENIITDLTLHDISIIFKIFKPSNVDIIGCNLTYEDSVAESAQILLKVDDSYTIFLSTSRQDQEKIRTLEIVDNDSTYTCDLKNKFYEIKKSGQIAAVDKYSITESNVLNKIDMLNKPETAEIQLESFLSSIIKKEQDVEHLEIVEKTHQLAYRILNT